MPSRSRLAVDSAGMPLGDVGELARSGINPVRCRANLCPRSFVGQTRLNASPASPDSLIKSGRGLTTAAGATSRCRWTACSGSHRSPRRMSWSMRVWNSRAIAFGFPSGSSECGRAHHCSISGLGRRHRQPPVISTDRDARGHRDGGFEFHAECNRCSGEVLRFGLAFHPPRASRTEL